MINRFRLLIRPIYPARYLCNISERERLTGESLKDLEGSCLRDHEINHYITNILYRETKELNTDTNSDTDIKSDTNTDINSDTNTDINSDTNTDTNSDTNTDINSDTNINKKE